jgi:hypothetical protein
VTLSIVQTGKADLFRLVRILILYNRLFTIDCLFVRHRGRSVSRFAGDAGEKSYLGVRIHAI